MKVPGTICRWILFLCLVPFWGAHPLTAYAGSVYYVSPSGDDTKAGTSRETAWKSLEKVRASSYQAGDRILFEGGQTFEGMLVLNAANSRGTPAEPVTVSSYGSGRAILSSGRESGIQITDASNVRISNLKIVGRPSGDGLAMGEGNSGVWIFNNNTALQSRIRLDHLEVTGFARGILVAAYYAPGLDDIRIEHISAHDNTEAGVELSGYGNTFPAQYLVTNVHIAYVEAFDNRGTGVIPKEKRNTTGSGIFIYGVDQAVIEHCFAHDNGGRNPVRKTDDNRFAGGPFGIWAYGNRVLMQYNEAANQRVHPSSPSDGGGFNLQASNSLFQYNYSHENDGPGFLFDSNDAPANPAAAFSRVQNVIVRYNISQNNGQQTGEAALWASGPQNHLRIYNNTLYARGAETVKPPVVLIQGSYGENAAGDDHGIHLFNNVFIAEDTTPILRVIDPGSGTNLRFENNAYFSVNGNYQIQWGAGDPYPGVDEWAQATGQEKQEQTVLAIVMDPVINHLGAGGTMSPNPLSGLEAYRLKYGSPLIDAGRDPAEFGLDPGARDFFGRSLPPKDGRFDIGAGEYHDEMA